MVARRQQGAVDMDGSVLNSRININQRRSSSCYVVFPNDFTVYLATANLERFAPLSPIHCVIYPAAADV